MLQKKSYIKFFSTFFFLFIFINNLLFAEGFVGSTLVKTTSGYKPINQFKENEYLFTYNFKEKINLNSRIKKIVKKQYDKCFKLVINNKEIIVAPDQKLFCPLRKGCWIKVQDIQPNDFILRDIKDLVRVEKIIEFKQPTEFFCFTLDSNHNYFVSEENLFVHNVTPVIALSGLEIISFSASFGSGGGPSGLVIGNTVGGIVWLGVAAINWYFSRNQECKADGDIPKNDKTSDTEENFLRPGNSPFDPDPEHDPKIPDKVKKALNAITLGRVTNATARVIAAYLDYQETKNYPFNSHGQLVFKNGSKYISADLDRHKGGFWKLIINNTRKTMNWNLTKIIGK